MPMCGIVAQKFRAPIDPELATYTNDPGRIRTQGGSMGTVSFSIFDASKYLDSQEAIDDYLAIARADEDAATMQLVLRDIARARARIRQAPQGVREEHEIR